MTLQDEAIRSITTLVEPTRRRLFTYVLSGAEPVGRDEAAAALGITRALAAFHLDRLVEAGLLTAEFRRLTGRRGPGAGRPAKLYQVSREGIEVSVPRRRHGLLATWLAQALPAAPGDEALKTLRNLASAHGRGLGRTARVTAGRRRSRRGRVRAGVEALAVEGFAPRMHGDSVLLANCPFQPIAESHRSLVCGQINRTLMDAFATALDADLVASYEPRAKGCCVTLRRR